MKRQMIVTITGNDGEDEVTVSVKFDPPLKDDAPPPSGFNHMAAKVFDTIFKSEDEDPQKTEVRRCDH